MSFNEAQVKALAAPLDPAHVKPPAPGKYGEYIEGWRVIDEANRIFGFEGWDRETVEMIETNRDLLTLKDKQGAEYQQWRVGYRAKVRIMVTAGGEEVVREGSGFGSGQGKPEALGDVIESAVKEAETDAMKRALMTFGYPFGLALYDKTKANVQAPPAEPITDDQRDLLASLAQAADISLQVMCEHYKIASLKELPAAKFADAKARLDTEISKKRSKAA